MSTDGMPTPAEKEEWTDEMNARRFALIDKQLDRSITVEEEAELKILTNEMRAQVDTLTILPDSLLEQLEDEAGEK